MAGLVNDFRHTERFGKKSRILQIDKDPAILYSLTGEFKGKKSLTSTIATLKQSAEFQRNSLLYTLVRVEKAGTNGTEIILSLSAENHKLIVNAAEVEDLGLIDISDFESLSLVD